MKEKILTLIIGVLVGAIITTGVFLIINTNQSKDQNGMMRGEPGRMQEQIDPNFGPGDMPSGEKPQGGQRGYKNKNNDNSTNSSNSETTQKPEKQQNTNTI